MKKRLLITSIVMMLVVAVALSTATYAWFTSNATVSASSISLTAATNLSSALGISYENANYTTTITADAFATEQQPMAPATLTVGTTEPTVGFFTSTIKSSAGSLVFNNPTDTNGHIVTFTSSEVIYLKNLSTSNAIASVPVTAEITDASGWLRAAIFVYDGTESKYLLKGVFGIGYTKATGSYDSQEKYYTYNSSTHSYDLVASSSSEDFSDYYVQGLGSAVYGAKPSAGSSVDTYNATKLACVDTITVATNLAAEGVVQIKVLVWTDGAALNDDTQGGTGTITLTFGQAQS